MISIHDLYTVLTADVAMILAYGSVKWWKIFSPDQCSGINRFVALFAVPLLSFHFISTNNPYAMNLHFIAADSLQKLIILVALFVWTRIAPRSSSLDWSITLFSLATLPNTLVMGIPLLIAMYGKYSGSLMVQIVVLQCIIWYTLLLFLFEYRAAKILIADQFPDNGGLPLCLFGSGFAGCLGSTRQGPPAGAGCGVGGDGIGSSTCTCEEIGRRHGDRVVDVDPGGRQNLGTGVREDLLHRLELARNADRQWIPISKTLDFYAIGPGWRCAPLAYLEFGRHRSLLGAVHGGLPLCLFGSGFAGCLGSTRQGPPAGAGCGVGGDGIGSSTCTCEEIGRRHGDRVVDVDPGGRQNLGTGVREDLLHRLELARNADRQWIPISKTLDFYAIGPGWRCAPLAYLEFGRHRSLLGAVRLPNVGVRRVGFLGCDLELEDVADHGAKEIRMVVPADLPQNGGTREGEDYGRVEDFSFGGGRVIDEEEGEQGNGPDGLTKLGSSSTAELHPKGNGGSSSTDAKPSPMPPASVMTRLILIMVWRKLIRNPNTYSSLIGLVWSLVAFRWQVAMPKIVEKSISILSDAGLGMAMFSLGLLYGAATKNHARSGSSVASFDDRPSDFSPALYPLSWRRFNRQSELRGTLLTRAIVQAALPQGIVPFVFAKEYNVHPAILSTAVIFGMLIALPITLVYYIILGL
ncbi:uncharacterized protein A4U43_UnF10810 [Asparagus officinalis]|uniref:Auxin efflux carrier component n=1 Tax=Asparagus officinalis TaxID=4686 RepID=A0A1R3L5F1_ASPOF|nr:uncharacterized protein A4U43_UnF10810 [Asparagus officinalis]